MREQVIDDLIDEYMPPKSYADQWDTDGLHEAIKDKLTIDAPVQDWAAEEGVDDEQVRERLINAADEMMAQKAAAFGPENMRNIEKQVLLQHHRQQMARASADAGTSALGRRLPWIRAARSAERIQERKFPAVRGYAGQPYAKP